jgi:transposase
LPQQPTYDELLVIIAELRAELASIKTELAQYKTPKNSSNSHKPPSTDIAAPKRNQSLREKSGKQPGGQFGHKGHTLEMREQPDLIIVHHAPCICSKCGHDLSAYSQQLIERRQVADIPPPPQTVYTEHQVYGKTCSCGYVTASVFPEGINAPIQYGPQVETMIAYLYSRQYIPFERMAELFRYAMGLSISTGSIANIILRFAQKAQPAYEHIKTSIEQADYVGADETGVKVNGLKHWFWTWQNDELTFIVHSESRGYDTIEENFPAGLPNAILVHDRWPAQLKCPAKGHQVCLAHLLRDLNYIQELHQSDWAMALKTVIKEAIALNGQFEQNHYILPNTARDALDNKLQQLLEQPIPTAHQKAISLQKKLHKIKDNILAFLHHATVPPDNNGSERAIRNVKVKQKISGQFKSEEGAQSFAVIRSLIDTAIKSGKEVFSELSLIANLARVC